MAIGELVVDWISTTKGKGFIESSTYFKYVLNIYVNICVNMMNNLNLLNFLEQIEIMLQDCEVNILKYLKP